MAFEDDLLAETLAQAKAAPAKTNSIESFQQFYKRRSNGEQLLPQEHNRLIDDYAESNADAYAKQMLGQRPKKGVTAYDEAVNAARDEWASTVTQLFPKKKVDSTFDKVANLARSFAGGAIGAVKSVANDFGVDTAVPEYLDSIQKNLQDGNTETSKIESGRNQERRKDAENSGNFATEIGTYLKTISAEDSFSAGGSIAPMLIGGVGAKLFGKAIGVARAAGAGLTGAEAAIAAGNTGASITKGTMLGLGAAQGVGEIKGGNAERVEKDALAANFSEADAKAMGVAASEYGNIPLWQLAAAAGIGAAGGITGAQRLVAGKTIQEGASKGLLNRITTQGLEEGLQEGMQGVQGRIEANRASMALGLTKDGLFTGAIGSFFSDSALGFGMGAVAGIKAPKTISIADIQNADPVMKKLAPAVKSQIGKLVMNGDLNALANDENALGVRAHARTVAQKILENGNGTKPSNDAGDTTRQNDQVTEADIARAGSNLDDAAKGILAAAEAVAGLEPIAEPTSPANQSSPAAPVIAENRGTNEESNIAKQDAESGNSNITAPERSKPLANAENINSTTGATDTSIPAAGQVAADIAAFNPDETGNKPNTEAINRALLEIAQSGDPVTAQTASEWAQLHEMAYTDYIGKGASRAEKQKFIDGTAANILATAKQNGMELDPVGEAIAKQRLDYLATNEANYTSRPREQLGDRRGADGKRRSEVQYRKDQAELESNLKKAVPVPANNIANTIIQAETTPVSPTTAPMVNTDAEQASKAENDRKEKIIIARRKQARKNGLAPFRDNPLLEWLMDKGIQDLSLKSEVKDFNPFANGIGKLYRSTGMATDMLVEQAVQDGFIPQGSTQNDFIALLRTVESKGIVEPVYSQDYQDKIEREAMSNAQLEAEIAATEKLSPAIAEISRYDSDPLALLDAMPLELENWDVLATSVNDPQSAADMLGMTLNEYIEYDKSTKQPIIQASASTSNQADSSNAQGATGKDTANVVNEARTSPPPASRQPASANQTNDLTLTQQTEANPATESQASNAENSQQGKSNAKQDSGSVELSGYPIATGILPKVDTKELIPNDIANWLNKNRDDLTQDDVAKGVSAHLKNKFKNYKEPNGNVVIENIAKQINQLDNGILNETWQKFVGKNAFDTELTLEQTTPIGLKAQDESLKAAATKKAADNARFDATEKTKQLAKENKMAADASLDDFSLGQSADLQFTGQKDMLNEQADNPPARLEVAIDTYRDKLKEYTDSGASPLYFSKAAAIYAAQSNGYISLREFIDENDVYFGRLSYDIELNENDSKPFIKPLVQTLNVDGVDFEVSENQKAKIAQLTGLFSGFAGFMGDGNKNIRNEIFKVITGDSKYPKAKSGANILTPLLGALFNTKKPGNYYHDNDIKNDAAIFLEGYKKPLASQSTPTTNPSNATAVRSAIESIFGNAKGAWDSISKSTVVVDTYASLPKDVISIKGLESINAYHGSPYTFDKFSLEHMGKGEGAQAYGWGLYFAGNKDVAEHYRKVLSGRNAGNDLNTRFAAIEIDGKPILEKYKLDLDAKLAEYAEQANGFDAYIHADGRARRWESLKNDETYKFKDYAKEKYDAWSKLTADLLNKKKISSKVTGRSYKVNIKPDEDTFLLWDKPLSEQTQIVKDALISYTPTLKEYIDAGFSAQNANIDFEKAKRLFDKTLASEFYTGANRTAQGDKQRSIELQKLGINGIKYLDGTSRDSGKGSYNYVVFDDAAVEILAMESRENGKAQAFFQPSTGKIYLATDRIQKGDEAAVWLHEVSHKQLLPLLGKENLAKLNGAVTSWRGRKEGTVEWAIYEAANSRADKAANELTQADKETIMQFKTRKQELYNAEFLAYAIEEAVNRGVTPNASKGTIVAAGWMAKVKQLFQSALEKLIGKPSELTANDLVAMAYGAAGLELQNGNKLDSKTRRGADVNNFTDSNIVALDRFDFSKLEKIGSGSDRDVYSLANGSVVKVAKTARGLTQNIYEGDYILDSFIPAVSERGLNYVVVPQIYGLKSSDIVTTFDENAKVTGNVKASEMLSELSKYSQKDFDNRTNGLQATLSRYGFSDLLNYDVLWSDFTAKRNWGYKDGKAWHTDAGTLGGMAMIDQYKGVKNLDDADFKTMYDLSRAIKKELGDIDKNTMYSLTPFDGKERARSVADTIKDRFTPDKKPSSLSDKLAIASTGKMTSGDADSLQQAKDWTAMRFADSTRPFDVWTRPMNDQFLAAKLIRDKNLAAGREGDFNRQVMNEYGDDIAKSLQAIVKASKANGKVKYDFETAIETVGNWLSAVYAPIANQNLLARDLRELQAATALATENPTPKNKSAVTILKNQYLKRKAAIETNRVIDPTKTPLDAGVAGGYNNATAKAMREAVEQNIDVAFLEALAKPIYAMNAFKLQTDIATGKVTAEAAANFDKSGKYVPLTGDPRMDESGADLFGTGSLNQSKDKKLGGRTSSLSQNAIDASFEQVGKTARYYGWVDFKDTLHNGYEDMLAQYTSQGLSQYDAVQHVKEDTGITRELETMQRPSDGVILYRKNGTSYAYNLNNEAATEALRSANVEPIPSALRYPAMATRLMARLVTQFLPQFSVVNAIRDVWEKSENLRTRVIALYPNIDMNQAGRMMIKEAANVPAMLKDISAVISQGTYLAGKGFIGKADPANENQRMIAQFLQDGGSSTWGDFLSADSASLAKKLKAQVGLSHKAMTAIETWNNSWEIISSFSAYKALVAQGVDSKSASETALELMNFRKGGTAMKPIKALYMFAQPIATGGQQLIKAMSTRRGQARYTAYLIAGMALYAMLRAGDDDDETGHNRMDELSSFLLERNIPIPMGKDENGVSTYGKIPVGFGMPQLAWGHGVNLIKTILGKQTAGELAGEVLKGGLKTFAPVAPSESSISKQFPIFFWQTVAPTFTKPIVNVALDKTAFGSPMTNSAFEKKDVARALQGRATTPDFYDDVAKLLAEVGVNAYPEQVREVMKGYIVGPSGEMIKAWIDNPAKEAQGKNPPSIALDRWIARQSDDDTKMRLGYRKRDELNELAREVSLGKVPDDKEKQLLKLHDEIKKLDSAARGKKGGATRQFNKSGNEASYGVAIAAVEKKQADTNLILIKRMSVIEATH
jgi:hypothetical protein